MTLSLSVANRQRLTLALFVILDHVIWFSGAQAEQVATFYCITAEVVRLTALAALVLGCWRKDALEAGVLLVMGQSSLRMK